MPRLPSGLHFALDPAPLNRLIEQSFEGVFVHDLMAIEHLGHVFRHIDVLYFRPVSDATVTREYALQSNRPPEELEPYPSGFTLFSIREPFATWSPADQEAFEAFLDEPRTLNFVQSHLDAVMDAKNQLLAQPATLPGLIATWWKAGCHPLQEDASQ